MGGQQSHVTHREPVVERPARRHRLSSFWGLFLEKQGGEMIQRERVYTEQLNVRLRPETLKYFLDRADAANSTPSTLVRRILERESRRDLRLTGGDDEAA